MNIPKQNVDYGLKNCSTVITVSEVYENTLTILSMRELVIKRYHYKLRHGYEDVFPHLPPSLKVLAEDHTQADVNVIIGYGYKALEKYQLFTITKI